MMITKVQLERIDWLLALQETCVAKGQRLSRVKTDELNNLLQLKLESYEQSQTTSG